ncbi:MAG: chemotaxis response regulator protein-glutamate methylesterase [archaeon]
MNFPTRNIMINVLVVDDSAFMRKVICDILTVDNEVKIVGVANNGAGALKKITELHPDVVTIDLHLPDIDGTDLIKQIMKENPVPIVVVSAFTKNDSAQIIEALQSGAVDFVKKPSGEISLNIREIGADIINKVKAAFISKLKTGSQEKKHVIVRKFNPSRKKIVVIGASAGGPPTLEALLTLLPKNIPVPILIVQHMPPGDFTATLANRLDSICEIRVREAKEGDELQNGVALIAPGGFHMELKTDNPLFEGKIALNTEPRELGVRPCVNRLFASAAKIFQENTIGIVLTGMGSDGKNGAGEIKKYNGTILAESEESCVIFGMPKEVIKAGLADEIVPIDKMAVALVQLVEV